MLINNIKYLTYIAEMTSFEIIFKDFMNKLKKKVKNKSDFTSL